MATFGLGDRALVGRLNSTDTDVAFTTAGGKIGIGTTTPTSDLDIIKDNASATETLTSYAGSVTRFSSITLRRANGTISAPTAVIAGSLGRIQAEGYNGTDFSIQSSFINFGASETFTPTAEGGNIQFWTTLIGGTAVAERMRILDNGNIGIGTSTPNANALLDVSSTTKAFMPPRMLSGQKTAIPTPTAGMVVYDIDLGKLCVYTTAWETITSV